MHRIDNLSTQAPYRRNSIGAPAGVARSAQRRKVMFVINSLAGGGAEKVLMTLLEHSRDQQECYDISLTILDNEKAEAVQPPSWLGIHRLDCQFSTLRSLRRLFSLVSAEKPDVVVSFLTRSNVASWFANALSQRPWIISERVNTSVQLGSSFRGALAKAFVSFAYSKAPKVIAVSTGVAETLIAEFGVRPNRVRVIGNPVDREELLRKASEAVSVDVKSPYIVAVGRLVPNKNLAMLIEAFAKSEFRGDLVIVGEGPERRSLEQLAGSLGITGRIRFTGFLRNPYGLISRATVYASASRAEGFPNALAESLVLNIPIVATNCYDGPAEILLGKTKDQVHGTAVADAGILVPVDDTEALIHAINMATTPDFNNTLIEGSRRRTDDFSPTTAADKYWQVIHQACADNPIVK